MLNHLREVLQFGDVPGWIALSMTLFAGLAGWSTRRRQDQLARYRERQASAEQVAIWLESLGARLYFIKNDSREVMTAVRVWLTIGDESIELSTRPTIAPESKMSFHIDEIPTDWMTARLGDRFKDWRSLVRPRLIFTDHNGVRWERSPGRPLQEMTDAFL